MAERGHYFKGLIAWSAIAATVLSACGEPEAFKGTVLTSGDHAPDFELTNQFGRKVNLTQYIGSPVLLTFLYTNCPDVCPITAGQLRESLDSLGEDAEDIRVAAISLDPERDTVKAALEFSDRWEMTGGWDFLVGERRALEPLWKAYYLEPVIHNETDSEHTTSKPDRGGGLGSLQRDFADRYLVIHSNPVYLLDAEGVMRVVHTSPLDPDEIAHDVRLLLD